MLVYITQKLLALDRLGSLKGHVDVENSRFNMFLLVKMNDSVSYISMYFQSSNLTGFIFFCRLFIEFFYCCFSILRRTCRVIQ